MSLSKNSNCLRSIAACLATSLASLACGGEETPLSEDLAEVRGGTAVPQASFPEAVLITIAPAQPQQPGAQSAFCSGVMIRPNVVLTAAHCVRTAAGRPTTVSTAQGAFSQAITFFQRSPQGVGADLGLMQLAGSIIPAGSQANILLNDDPNAPLDALIVGYGQESSADMNNTNRTQGNLRLTNYAALVQEPSFAPIFEQYAPGATNQIACPGDSGAPIYANLDANPGFETVIGILQGGPSVACDAVNFNNAVLPAASRYWIEGTLRRIANTPAANRNEFFVRSLYENLLGRDAAQADVNQGVNALASGTSRTTLSDLFLNSRESSSRIATRYFQELLGRSPSVAERDYWAGQIETTRQEEVEARIVESQEYFNRAGATVNGFVQLAYLDILDRPADPVGLQLFTTIANTQGRLAVAQGLINSTEGRSIDVRAWYAYYLGRVPTQTEVDGWTTLMAGGTSHRAAQATFLGSPEYFDRYAF